MLIETKIKNKIKNQNKKRSMNNNSVRNNDNYPLMSKSEWDNAPWNQEDLKEREIEVLVSVTLSKTVKIKVSDYIIKDSGKDEDSSYYENIDYSDCDLGKAVKNQVCFPQDAYKYIIDKKIHNDLKNWKMDEFEIMLK